MAAARWEVCAHAQKVPAAAEESQGGVPFCPECGDDICRCQERISPLFPGPAEEENGPKIFESDVENKEEAEGAQVLELDEEGVHSV